MNRTVAASAACFLAGAALWPLGRLGDDGPRLRGTVTVFAHVEDTTGCAGVTGFDDIAGGAPVRAADDAGNVLATGRLGPGEMLKDRSGCVYAFSLGKLRDDAVVVLAVGNRQGLRLTAAQLSDVDHRVDLRLGAGTA